ncbi:T9SS type A sorting domain-containing protein [Flavobacteriaceae bacterium]|nr:T9SS type A sorting domain-containing protein [Flavobacteriaceae bacterium]
MKKITLNLTKSFWRSGLLAMAFLFSLTINSQEVGQEYLVNPGINTATGQYSTTPETGVDGGGNFPANLGGWTNGIGGAFASASDANGECHSADRMFKFFKVGGADGQYVNQTITDLPAGNYNWSFYTKWGDAGHASGPTGTAPGNLPSWSAEGDNQPKFTILVQDADGAWVADQATVTTEPTTVLTWVQDSGTWTNTETRDVRIKFAKNGGSAANGGSNTDKLMYIDDASLTYASAITSSGESIPWTDSFETEDVWTNSNIGSSGAFPWKYGLAASFENPPAAAQDGAGLIYFDDYSYSTGTTGTIMSPEIDLSTATAPIMTFYHYDADGADTVEVIDGVGTVLFTTPSTSAEWTKFTVDLSAYIGGSVNVGFKGTSVYGYSNPHIDNVYVGETPTEPAMSVSATTDGGSATFSFTVDNFTVGAAAGEGDGHIHWSIFSASDLNTPIYENVMVYSTDDLTLSPLPNGDHVIVFSLVDPSHQPLDPAVEATVEFSTFDGTAACDETVTYTQVANGDYTVALTAPDGQVASVTVNGDIESGYDFIYVTDGAGNALNADQNTGVFTDAVFTSTDGTISVNVTNDGSVQNGDVTLAFSCEEVSTSGMITFNVDMNAYSGSQYEDFGAFVNGEFTGWCGTCAPMTDDDGDGIWTTTLYLENGTYFWKYTVNGWNDQESFNGTEVVDGCTAQNGDNIDRFLVVNGDQTLDTVFFNMCAGETPGSSLELQGIIDFTVPSGGSDGKAIHVVATENIPNLAYYGIGVANNGGGTDGQEFTFPSQSMAAGQHYLAARSVDVMNTYMDASSVYDVVSSEGEGINDISQNGDDAIELYMGGNAVELFGELDVDGSGQPWEYLDSWAYKVDGAWTYGEVDTTDGTETICEASTPYPFADCSGPGCGDSWEYTYVNNEDGATILYTFSNGGDSSVLSVTVTGQTETGYDNLIITDGAGAELYNASGDHTGQVVTSGDGVINIAISSDTSYAPGSDQLGNGTAMTFDATCEAAQNAAVIALLESGSWRVDAETAGHMGVGPDSQFYAEWWNANPWDKWETGLYDDRWSFAAGTMTHDTGDDGAIFGKKPALDAAFPDNTAYDADNGDDEYLYYIQDDYTDTYTVSEEGAETTSVTMAGIGQVGFFVGGAEHIVLESTETTMYLRNLGTEGVGNSWYHRLTTAEALSTVDAMVLDMRIYPNPSNGSYVTIQTPVNGVKYVEVFDITGKRLINTSLSADTLDVSSMSSGMYLVKVTVEGQSKTSKLIIR